LALSMSVRVLKLARSIQRNGSIMINAIAMRSVCCRGGFSRRSAVRRRLKPPLQDRLDRSVIERPAAETPVDQGDGEDHCEQQPGDRAGVAHLRFLECFDVDVV